MILPLLVWLAQAEVVELLVDAASRLAIWQVPLPLLEPLTCGATFGIEHLRFNLTHTLTHSPSLVLVVTMRSKKLKTSRSILMLMLRFSLEPIGRLSKTLFSHLDQPLI